MSDRAAVIAALTEYANKPATSHDLRADANEIFGSRAIANLMRFVQSLGSREELNALLAEVAALIRVKDPFRAAVIAINCGSLVEFGGDPGVVFPHLLDVLPRYLPLAIRGKPKSKGKPSREEQEKLFESDPDAAKAAAGLTYLLLPTMAVICRQMELREALRANAEIVAGITALRDTHAEANFVSQVIGYTDGIDLLVLAPEEQKGFRVSLEAINTNFHLFTLLQAALISAGHLAGEAPDAEVIAVASGEAPHQKLLRDHARWHFYSWSGLNPDGTFASGDFRYWIPGDSSPRDIPQFEGQRILVIGPPLLGARMWDSNFFANIHDALRSRVEVTEVLSPEQAAGWLARIRQAKR